MKESINVVFWQQQHLQNIVNSSFHVDSDDIMYRSDEYE